MIHQTKANYSSLAGGDLLLSEESRCIYCLVCRSRSLNVCHLIHEGAMRLHAVNRLIITGEGLQLLMLIMVVGEAGGHFPGNSSFYPNFSVFHKSRGRSMVVAIPLFSASFPTWQLITLVSNLIKSTFSPIVTPEVRFPGSDISKREVGRCRYRK